MVDLDLSDRPCRGNGDTPVARLPANQGGPGPPRSGAGTLPRTGRARGSTKGGRLHHCAGEDGTMGRHRRGVGETPAHRRRRCRGHRLALATQRFGRAVARHVGRGNSDVPAASDRAAFFLVGVLSRWRARFGFNRVSPRLFAVDFAKRAVLGAALGGPLLLATLTLMEHAGAVWWLWVCWSGWGGRWR